MIVLVFCAVNRITKLSIKNKLFLEIKRQLDVMRDGDSFLEVISCCFAKDVVKLIYVK
jgi:hypothetical protein